MTGIELMRYDDGCAARFARADATDAGAQLIAAPSLLPAVDELRVASAPSRRATAGGEAVRELR